jgi:alkylation response protein AidB-like acyl-CoA dehydrogenase
MDISFTPSQSAFRLEVRGWLKAHVPIDLAEKVSNGAKLSKAEHIAWQQILAAKGWLAPSWPAEWGGPGWDPVERFIFDEEAHMAGVPRANIPGIDLLGPALIEFGTEAQKRRFLPRILSAEDWWCQGFSEPGAGSDLAALSTRAIRSGDEYLVNGTKLWTSHAQNSNWIFCLVRTSIEERKQAGISFLLIDMNQPGVTVTPIVTIAGLHHVNQVTIEDVRVPAENLVGGEGQGWEITKFLLGHERILGAWIGSSAKLLSQLKALFRQEFPEHDPLNIRGQIAQVEIDLIALKYTAYRVLAEELAGRMPGPEVSVLKLKGTEIQQRLSALLMEACGPLSIVDPLTLPPSWEDIIPANLAYQSQHFFDRRKMSIYGGAAEIQRNIIAAQILRK